MPAYPLHFTDGYLGTEREISVIPQVTYPFGANPVPDVYHRRLARQFQVAPRCFSPRIGARTTYENVVPQSNNYGTFWTQADVTVVSDYGFAPWDGSQSVDLLIESATTAQHAVGIAVNYAAAQYCMWAVAKAVPGRDWCFLLSNTNSYYWFNLATGQPGSSTNCTPRPARDLGNGYYLISAYFTAPSGASTFNFYLTTGDGALAAYLGSTATGVWLAQMQVNLGTAPGPLILTGASARTINAPDLDLLANPSSASADPFAYLVIESDPLLESSARALFSRLYARIPAAQVMPATKYITRPVLHNVKSGSAYAVSFDEAQDFSWIFTSRKVVNAVTSFPGGTLTGVMPGTNITMTDSGGHSVSFPANDTAPSIQAAVAAALTSLSGIIVYAGTGYLTVQWTGSMASIVPPTGVIVSSFSSYYVNFNATGTTTTPASLVVQSTAHGGVVGDRVALWNGDAIVGLGVVASVATADQFTLIASTLSSPDSVISHCAFSSSAASCVVNGTISCSCRRTQRYYLPGVSLGITTFADIPVPIAQMDPKSWLAAIIAGAAWAVESVNELIAAPGLGPILMQETLEVQMADAVDLVTP